MTYAIGIDPGRHTGLAVYDIRKRVLVHCSTTDFWAAYTVILEDFRPESCVIIVEDPAQNKPVFERGESGAKAAKIASNVGANKREATLLIDGLRRSGYTVRAVRPTESKWSNDTFKAITGYQGRSSEHSRDAARLCWGRNH